MNPRPAGKKKLEQAAALVSQREADLACARAKVTTAEKGLAALDAKAQMTAADMLKQENLTRELGRLWKEVTNIEGDLTTATEDLESAEAEVLEAEHQQAVTRREAAETTLLARATEIDAELLASLTKLHRLRQEESQARHIAQADDAATGPRLFTMPTGFGESALEAVASSLKRHVNLHRAAAQGRELVAQLPVDGGWRSDGSGGRVPPTRPEPPARTNASPDRSAVLAAGRASANGDRSAVLAAGRQASDQEDLLEA